MQLLPAFTSEPQPNKVYNVDALLMLRAMKDCSVDIVVTSPPYNLKNSTGNGMSQAEKGKWVNRLGVNWYSDFDDDMPHDEYVTWQRLILAECMRVIKPAGAIFYNHKWRVQAGLIQDRSEIVDGFPVRQIIIWQRKGGLNFNDTYFLPTYEVIYMIAKPDFRLTPKANAYGDIWSIPQETDKAHPNSFPVEIPRRCIEASGARTVVDPFGGAGTTAKAAQIQGADYFTCDLSLTYCELARNRLKQAWTPSLFENVV